MRSTTSPIIAKYRQAMAEAPPTVSAAIGLTRDNLKEPTRRNLDKVGISVTGEHLDRLAGVAALEYVATSPSVARTIMIAAYSAGQAEATAAWMKKHMEDTPMYLAALGINPVNMGTPERTAADILDEEAPVKAVRKTLMALGKEGDELAGLMQRIVTVRPFLFFGVMRTE